MHKYEITHWMEHTDHWYSIYDFPLHAQLAFAPDKSSQLDFSCAGIEVYTHVCRADGG